MMAQFDSSIDVPVTRANYYPHQDAVSPSESGIRVLEVTRLSVGCDVVTAGRVTLSACGGDPYDSYGYELDLSPEAARLLAQQLEAAATHAESEGGSAADSGAGRAQRPH